MQVYSSHSSILNQYHLPSMVLLVSITSSSVSSLLIRLRLPLPLDDLVIQYVNTRRLAKDRLTFCARPSHTSRKKSRMSPDVTLFLRPGEDYNEESINQSIIEGMNHRINHFRFYGYYCSSIST
ncbi:MAG: hypothetical protein ACI8RD_005834 [Bacillariaceae sp.]|jgi:hypothetical protein